MASPSLLLDRRPCPAHPFAGMFVSRGQGEHPRRTIDSYELIHVVGGTLSLYEEDRRFDLRTGQSLLLWPGREHGPGAPYDAKCRFYWLHFVLPERRPRVSAAPAEAVRIPQLCHVDRPECLVGFLRRYLDDQQSGRLTPVSSSCLITLMLHELAMSGAPSGSSRGAATAARQAHDFIVEHAREPISTADIARALGFNADYLGRCYRSAHGHGLIDAIHRQRLLQARALLLDTNESVETIAVAAGFSSAIYFRRLFKRAEGISPLAYRRQHARVLINTV